MNLLDIWSVMNKLGSQGLIFFVSGYTELEFFKSVVNCIQHGNPRTIEDKGYFFRNIRSIRTSRNRATSIFKNQIICRFPDTVLDIVLCYDSASGSFNNWNLVADDLKEAGANRVIHIKAQKNIEDWYLKDYTGILTYLNLPLNTPLPCGTGLQKMQVLFKLARNVYIKGAYLEGFIQQLDIDRIVNEISKELKPLTKLMAS